MEPMTPARFGALRHRDFRLFIAGQLVSLVGTWLQGVAQSWLVYRLTGSAALLGVVGFCGAAPVLLFAPLGGAAGDRWSRRRLVILTQSAAAVLALALGILTLAKVVTPFQIMVVAVLGGIVTAFDVPIRQSFVVEMVGHDDLHSAIALNSSAVNGARILGPAVGGVLVASFGEGWCFVLNAASYLAVIAALAAMRLPGRPRAAQPEPPLKAMREGFRYVARRSPAVRVLLLQLGIVSLLGMSYAVLMPIFADRILHGGPRGLGLLMGATGVGALAAALYLASRRSVRGLSRWVGSAGLVMGAGLLAFSRSESFWLSAGLLTVIGAGFMTLMAGTNTLVQHLVPDALRSRVMAVYTMTFVGLPTFGALLVGFAAERFGAPATVTVSGVAVMATGAGFALYLPRFRAAARAEIAARAG